MPARRVFWPAKKARNPYFQVRPTFFKKKTQFPVKHTKLNPQLFGYSPAFSGQTGKLRNESAQEKMCLKIS